MFCCCRQKHAIMPLDELRCGHLFPFIFILFPLVTFIQVYCLTGVNMPSKRKPFQFINLTNGAFYLPRPLRTVFIDAICCQVFVSGWYRSTVFHRLSPSNPPTTYRHPPHATTPAPSRATDIEATNVQRFVSGSYLWKQKAGNTNQLLFIDTTPHMKQRGTK